MSMIADFMRSEIIFRYGGFYLDTNYQILQTCLHKYQKYKLFLTEPESYFSHITLQGGLFGAPPRSPYVARLL